MSDLNREESKAVDIIKKLKSALDKNDQKSISRLNSKISELDPTVVKQTILDDLDELFEHPDYSAMNSN